MDMNWISMMLWEPSVAHSILLVALVIALGLFLGRIKVCGISLGVTWILFVGIFASAMGLQLDDCTSHFVKEFGLILFIYSIGMQVGPGFFSSFRKGGVTYNLLASGMILMAVGLTVVFAYLFNQDVFAMIGVLYGAVTNTPGLGAAQQTYSDLQQGSSNALFAQGYAMAYPLGVTGIILCIILLKYIFRIDLKAEQNLFAQNNKNNSETLTAVTLQVQNQAVFGKNVKEIQEIAGRRVIMSRILHKDTRDVETVSGKTCVGEGDFLYLVCAPADVKIFQTLIGGSINEMSQKEWNSISETKDIVCGRIVVTNPKLNGKRLGDLALSETFHVAITRVKRAGVDFIADAGLVLQLGDRLTVVGKQSSVQKVQDMLGDSVKKLDQPNVMAIFLGIAVGVLFGSMPIFLPGMPVSFKFGLAGGPLIVSILISKFGSNLKLITYTTSSANLMMREIGICLFMASVGLSAGNGFWDTVIHGGYWWILIGFLITIIPCLTIGVIGRYWCKLSYFTISGILSGATTDPPALAYSNSISGNDQAAVAYSTVYPLSMFLRVITAQVLVIWACG